MSSPSSSKPVRSAPAKKNGGLLIPLGMKLRDEFLCPITRLLITDPVIASDGHTYDRPAIERWLKTHSTSPKTGSQLPTKSLVPNITLKRLLSDLLSSSSPALFCEDTGSGDLPLQRVKLVKENVLVCKCLGPVESQWNGKSFRANVQGVIGGRRRPKEETEGRDFIQFSDATVSRRHFEIKFRSGSFYVMDLGSAGGTFVRVVKDNEVRVKRGMMVMVGKHQLVFSRPGEESEIKTGVKEASEGDGTVHNPDFGGEESKAKSHSDDEEEDEEGNTQVPNDYNANLSLDDEDNYHFPSGLSCKCFAPEGTPIQGKIYPVTPSGATLGRKTCNSISFSQTVDSNVVGLDSSISGEHAHVSYKGGSYYIQDGKNGRSSTNGTWLRLSPMHKVSEEFEITNGAEILIGTVRFHCFMEEQVVEKDVETDEEGGEDNEEENDLSATVGSLDLRSEE
mmetsp:Transcript_8198/g.14899  ORF Transcript_8198/g.14899 Transcript_8198/m.14899 type:complete len:451 (-) Transcript_8198:31-1383(-)